MVAPSRNLIPMQHRAEPAAIVAKTAIGGAQPLIGSEFLLRGIIADVTGLKDDQIFAMMGVRAMPIGGDLAADPPMVEGKGAEMLRQQDHRIALALVRAEGARGHHQRALKAQRQAVIIQPRHEQAVAHRPLAELKIVDDMAHRIPLVGAGSRTRRLRMIA
jgi:hypothetical protein